MTEETGSAAKPPDARPRTQNEYVRIFSEFEAGQRDLQAAWLSEQKVPERLYHYTTLDGLQGIIRSQSFWASDARYMNDSSELTYATELIDEEVQQFFTSHDLLSDYFNALDQRHGLASAFEGVRPYIACFCAVDDLLSQWRGYGQSDAPVSIGLDSSIAQLTPREAYFRRVVYDEGRQRSLVRDSLAAWGSVLEALVDAEGHRPEDLLSHAALWGLRSAMNEFHLCFKHPAFSEEKEWRLMRLLDPRAQFLLAGWQKAGNVDGQPILRIKESGGWHQVAGTNVRLPPGVDVHFRRSTYGFTPYIELPFHGAEPMEPNDLPIRSVTQGPRAHAQLALESLDLYLESEGFAFIDVKPSWVPLRR